MEAGITAPPPIRKGSTHSRLMHYADYKTILSPKNGMNIYRGCTHGCIYCDSRSTCYQMKHEFEDIEVKRNAAEILESQLKRRRQRCMISTGAMCDPYIPLEATLKSTRQCIEVIEKYGFGLTILTKSTLALRDVDLFQAVQRKAKCVVQTTLTTHDPALCQILEPNVALTHERVRMLEIMRDEGIPTVVWLGPLLPFINDSAENLQRLLEDCARAKVHGILCFGFGMTLREGNREYFYRKLDQHFPGIKEKYMETFGNAYSCSSPNNERLMAIFRAACQKYGILWKTGEVLDYLGTFERKEPQLRLF